MSPPPRCRCTKEGGSLGGTATCPKRGGPRPSGWPCPPGGAHRRRHRQALLISKKKMLIISEQQTSKAGGLSPEPGCGAEGCVPPPSRAASRPPAPAPSPGAQLRSLGVRFFFFPRVSAAVVEGKSRSSPQRPRPFALRTVVVVISFFFFFTPARSFFSISQSSPIFRFSSTPACRLQLLHPPSSDPSSPAPLGAAQLLAGCIPKRFLHTTLADAKSSSKNVGKHFSNQARFPPSLPSLIIAKNNEWLRIGLAPPGEAVWVRFAAIFNLFSLFCFVLLHLYLNFSAEISM